MTINIASMELSLITVIFHTLLSSVLIYFIFLYIRTRITLSIRQILFSISTFIFLLILFYGILIMILYTGTEKQYKMEENKFSSFNVAVYLKRSSDDLTRMARLFAVTGDSKYEEYFRSIFEIRNGTQALPKEFSKFYWDYVIADLISVNEDGKFEKFYDKMKNLNFSEEEYQLIEDAMKLSDGLMQIECTAINAVKGLFRDSDGKFTIEGEPDRDMAIRILHGDEYHLLKAGIIKKIDKFFVQMENRTTQALLNIRSNNIMILRIIVILTLISAFMSINIIFVLKNRFLLSLSILELGTHAIENGDYLHKMDIETY